MSKTSEDPNKQPDLPDNGPDNGPKNGRDDTPSDPWDDHVVVKKRVFLEHLAVTSSVKKSAAVADIPNSTLYVWKANDPDFGAAWLKALAAGYELLEMDMLERARRGVKRKIFYRGKVVGKVRDYDNKSALQLLRLHKETVALVRAAQAELAAEPEPVRDTLDEKLKKINVRLRAYQAEKRRKKQVGAEHKDAGDEGGESHAAGEKNGKRVGVIDDA